MTREIDANRAHNFDEAVELFGANPNDPDIRRARADYIDRGQEAIPAHARRKRANAN